MYLIYIHIFPGEPAPRRPDRPDAHAAAVHDEEIPRRRLRNIHSNSSSTSNP